MMTKAYYLTDDHVLVEIPLSEWRGSQKLAKNTRKGITVSTVFLGIPHYGGMFETMIFGGPYDQEMYRCETYEDAMKAHNAAVAFFKKMNWFERYLDGNILNKKPLPFKDLQNS